MKLKFKQSIYIVDIGSIEAGREIEITNKAQAKSFIEADYAEEVVVEEKPKAPVRKKVIKDGE